MASHSDFSRYTIAGLAAQGKTFWRNSSSFTGSYTIRISRGNYLGAGLSYRRPRYNAPRSQRAYLHRCQQLFLLEQNRNPPSP